jgi:hypothetical protein
MSSPSNALTITETLLEKRRRNINFMKRSQDPHLKFTSGHLSLQDVQSCPSSPAQLKGHFKMVLWILATERGCRLRSAESHRSASK